MINNKSYIGQTVNVSKRWHDHRRQAANPHYPIHLAIRKYGNDNFIFEVIACCLTQEDADLTEIELIAQYGTFGLKGYNCNVGGKKATQSAESREKNRLAHLGKKHTDEAKAKIAEASRNREWSEESKTKLSESKKGKSTWVKGKYLSDEHKAALSKSKKGKPNPALIGHKHTEESKKKMSDSKKGTKYSEASKKKMSESAKKRWSK